MLISKFDLYKTGWLDLVFENRNKSYGAYELRQTYASNMVKAMGITFFSIAVLCGASIALQKTHHTDRGFVVDMIPPILPPPTVVPPKKVETPPPAHSQKTPLQTVQTIKYVPPVVVEDQLAQEPVKTTDLTAAIGTETKKGITPDAGIPAEPGPPAETKPVVDETIHFGADVMPEPDGGVNGWAKFLSRTLRFPAQAEESGRVILSFVVEKDGHLSNIVVEKAAGHGFDEEAVRVLKLAKPWKPGLQAGQPVRVKYTIPINFQLTE
jgi:protein TonB